MPKFIVTIGRKVYDYLEVEVEAEDVLSAERKALDEAVARHDDPAWDAGDCEYYETGIEEVDE